MILRRPNMLRHNSWIDSCTETLARNPNPHPLDGTLLGWVRLMKITESIHTSISFDDFGNLAKLSDPRTQLLVSGFEKELAQWRKSLKVASINSN